MHQLLETKAMKNKSPGDTMKTTKDISQSHYYFSLQYSGLTL